MADEDINEIAAVVTVTLYANEYSTVTIQPGQTADNPFDDYGAVRAAARRLSDIVAVATEQRLPVECTVCGTLVEGIVTEPDGTHVLRPCGDSFP